MQATGIYFTGLHQVALRSFELPDPDLFEVQIALRASAICAMDQAYYNGIISVAGGYPFLSGHEGVGVVQKVGARVTGLREGDLVAAIGGGLFGQYANLHQSRVARLRPDITDYQNWIAEPVMCVMNGLQWSQIVPGDRAAVVGTGYMGLLLVQGLVHALTSEVVAIDVDPRRLELAARFGADRTINPTTAEGQAALQELAADPVDLLIEAAGVQSGFDLHYDILRRAGRLTIFAAHRDADRLVSLAAWHSRGYQVYNASPSITPEFHKLLPPTVRMMERGVFDMRPLISHVRPAAEAQELFDIAANHRDGYIKGVLLW